MSVEQVPELVAAAVAHLPAGARPPDLETLLCGYLAHLLERNREMNLVSRRDTLQHVERFTRECLFLASILIDERTNRRHAGSAPHLLDIGSGNGFPGIVLKIAIPDLDVVLVEATRKKARFLADVAAGLDLRQTRIVGGRTEDLERAEKAAGRRELRNHFDWVTGKGLGSLRDSTLLAAPFLAPDGVHWTFKGASLPRELEAASGVFRQRGFTVHRVERIPESENSSIVGIRRPRGS